MTEGTGTIAPAAQTAPASARGRKPQAADVLVVFGITGDLARVMTFRSLYRLEARGLLDCPIVGVAVDDWTDDQIRTRARESIEGTGEQLDQKVFDRFAERLSYLSGDFADAATYERVAAAIDFAESPVFYLEIPPFLFGRVVAGLAQVGLMKTGRVVVEKPFGHDRESATALADELHRYVDESQLYRIDHYLGKMGLDEILYGRFANTMFEPIWNRNYIQSVADHDGGGLRRRGPRPLLRPGRGAARRLRQPPHAGRRRGGDGTARGRRPRDAQGRPGRTLSRDRRRRPRALRARTVRRLPATSTASRRTPRPRPTRRCAWRSTTGAGPACRSSSALASACPPRRPSCGSCSSRRLVSASSPSRGRTSPTSSCSSSIPRREFGCSSTPSAGTSTEAEDVTLDLEFADQGGEGATPYEVLLHAAMVGDSSRFKRQDVVEENWRIMEPLLNDPPPVHPYKPGSWGPEAADKLVAGHGRWHGPWVAA